MDDLATRRSTRRSAAEWRAIMARYEASGLIGEGFCEADGIGRARSGAGAGGWRTGMPGVGANRCSWNLRAIRGRRGTPSWSSAPASCCGSPSAVLIPAARRVRVP